MTVSRRRSPPRTAWLAAALLLFAGLGLSAAAGAEARTPLPQCADNIDNDGDGKIDFPFDPGCSSLLDTAEFNSSVGACADGIDGDNDGRLDFPADSGCSSASDSSEGNPGTAPLCANTLDDDGDGRRDFVAFQTFLPDLGCSWAAETSETDTQCSDGVDNDGDGQTDFPADFGCGVAVSSTTPAVNDNSEIDPPECDDGRDNDGDGNVDVQQDPDCSSATDTTEAPPPPPPLCADGVDNDGDGKIDLEDPGCSSAADDDEVDAPIGYPLPPGNLAGTTPGSGSGAGGSGGSGGSAPVSPSSRVTRLLTPFPIVRLRGSVEGRLIRVSLLSVRAPAGSKVTVYCSGGGCPAKRVGINAGRKLVRVRSFEKRLRGGTILKIYVTKRGFLGKYTRFRFVSNRAPLRVDRCATTPGFKPKLCPSS